MSILMEMLKTFIGVLLASTALTVLFYPIYAINLAYIGSKIIEELLDFILTILGWLMLWTAVAIVIVSFLFGLGLLLL